mmetsp:Transcript_20717/g.52621  ORF Transcript_20717/g.52621 Transcript_20717/m.52621 type:complete len:193 (+) Transcript_20717:103-681(+)
MAEAKTKIIVVGPVKCGKSRLVNQIAGLESEPNLEAYVPTAGVRILEFDREIAHSTKRGGSRSVNLAVELWDCSGDQQYEACWPAILSGVVGVLLVFNPENPSGERDVVKWYSAFIAKLKLSDAQVLVLAHHMDTESFNPATSPKGLSKFKIVDTTLDTEGAMQEVKGVVNDFLTRVGAVALAKHESEFDAL